MENLAFVVGILAVTLYFVSYQQRKRKNIILFNATSRILYIIQYILLDAFEGAVLDICGAISSILANNKDKGFIKKHLKLIVILINILIAIFGLMMYKNIFSICPIVGVILHTSAFWITDEKMIRRVSLLGSPFWMIYNIYSRAYGSVIGDALSIISIATAIYRYDVRRNKFETK